MNNKRRRAQLGVRIHKKLIIVILNPVSFNLSKHSKKNSKIEPKLKEINKFVLLTLLYKSL